MVILGALFSSTALVMLVLAALAPCFAWFQPVENVGHPVTRQMRRS